jgi:hypothetical protein
VKFSLSALSRMRYINSAVASKGSILEGISNPRDGQTQPNLKKSTLAPPLPGIPVNDGSADWIAWTGSLSRNVRALL